MAYTSDPSSPDGGTDGTWQLGVKKLTLSESRLVRECVLSAVVEQDDPLSLVVPSDKAFTRTAPLVSSTSTVPSKTLVQASSHRGTSSNDVVALEAGELDPLSAFMSDVRDNHGTAANATLPPPTSDSVIALSYVDPKNELLDEWTVQKDVVFQTFSAERFHITLHANDDATDSDVKKKVVYSNSTTSNNPVMQRARARLEQLENPTALDEPTTIEVSQSEYISRIKALQQDFLNAWHDDQKVLALRITIKCIKLLGDTSFPKFYPCMFVLVSDVLDCFGAHVFNRIKAKADDHHVLP
ncbi:hypothetical protein DYB37_013926, partial [Aphanomyces astaci]